MKKIEAIIQPGKCDEVVAALEGSGYRGITVTEVQGHGKQKGITQNWLGRKIKIEMLPKMKLEMVVLDGEVEQIVRSVIASAKTGRTGDGKIFVYPIEQAYRISSGEEGEAAL